MRSFTPLLITLCMPALYSVHAELRVPAYTAYIEPDANGAKVSKEHGVSNWTKLGSKVLWFGEFKESGVVQASLAVQLPPGESLKLRLTLGSQTREALAHGGRGEQCVTLGDFRIVKPGYARFELNLPVQSAAPKAEILTLVLNGEPTATAHFNVDPRRNAASVHLMYPVPKGAQVTGFYNEVTAVEDPVATYYMACGFARGYFGMQVNSPTERRIIFSVWDSGAGGKAKDRTSVSKEDQVQLLAKGPAVDAGAFGNEGTGGHSHLVYPWKTGSTQRFFVTAKPAGTHTDYSGWWFHPDQKRWMLIASFRAPGDGGYLRGLYSFSENFGGSNGHLQRKALFGPQWIRLANGQWNEITEASFSHDPTGKANRIDRFMGVEEGRFFLSNGGFVPGFTAYGDRFTRPATEGWQKSPPIQLLVTIAANPVHKT